MKRSEIYSFESKQDGPPLSLDWFMETTGILLSEALPTDLDSHLGIKSYKRIKGNMFEANDVFQWRDYMLELSRRRQVRIEELECERTAVQRDEMSDNAYRFMISSMTDAQMMLLHRVEEFTDAFQQARIEMDTVYPEPDKGSAFAASH